MTRVTQAVLFVLVAAALAAPAAAQAPTPEQIKTMLGLVPDKDPAVASAPSLLPAVAGQHPRLLFSKTDIAELKKLSATDAILKKACEDTCSWARRFTLAKAWNPTGMFKDDTSALVMFKSWPGLAYAYALEPNAALKNEIVNILKMMVEQPHWNNALELDCNMGSANDMAAAAILFDAVADELEPEFRVQVARKLLTHVRRMYYLGLQQLNVCPPKYWQQDPQNNHRWHRACGTVACLTAIADEKGVDAGFMLQEYKKEMDFLVKWLPADGDCHEGAGYQVFGFEYLALAAMMTDRNLGTKYLEAPGFRNAWAQHLYYWAPGRMGDISFGDDMNGEGPFDNQEAAFFLCPRLTRDKNVQAALVRQFQKKARFSDPKRVYTYPWALLTFYDPTLTGGDYKAIPTSRPFPDLGGVSMRDSWEDDAVCFTFKCGPYGGARLNEYLLAVRDPKTGKPHYVNVAHDDPDVNSFAIGAAGEFLFHPGLYSFQKVTRQLSTVTVDGKGQIGEGTDFTQPVPETDMRTLAWLTGWKTDANGRIIVEGEGAKAYGSYTSSEGNVVLHPSPLKTFRRTVVWLPGEYILMLDDIAADGNHRILWRGTVPKGQFEKPEVGSECTRAWSYTKGGKRLDFQMLSNREITGALDTCLLDGRFGNELCQQFQFAADAPSVKFACLVDPWKKKAEMTLQEEGGAVTLTVKGEGFSDVWTWKPAADEKKPSSLAGQRGGKELIGLTEKDVPPKE